MVFLVVIIVHYDVMSSFLDSSDVITQTVWNTVVEYWMRVKISCLDSFDVITQIVWNTVVEYWMRVNKRILIIVYYILSNMATTSFVF